MGSSSNVIRIFKPVENQIQTATEKFNRCLDLKLLQGDPSHATKIINFDFFNNTALYGVKSKKMLYNTYL